MTDRLQLQVLNSDDCFECRRCCRFDPEELDDAPMFTKEQHAATVDRFGLDFARFEVRGSVFRVILEDIPGSEKKICPFYEIDTAACRVFDLKLFDCYTWPFYIMNMDGELVITLSPDCPVVLTRTDLGTLVRYAKETLGPQMLEVAQQYPDLVTIYHGNATLLCKASDFSK